MYIYIITHPKFDGWIKLGRALNVSKRLENYQTYCPDRAFKLEYSLKTEYVYHIELYFENNIKGNRYEWYKCSVEYAMNLINEALKCTNKFISEGPGYNSGNSVKKSRNKIRYDYLVDGKIFNTIAELRDYTGLSRQIFNNIVYKNKFEPGKVININGYEAIRRNHVE